MEMHENQCKSLKINENRTKIGRDPMATGPAPEKVRKSNDSTRPGPTKTMKIRGWPEKAIIIENQGKFEQISGLCFAAIVGYF